MIKNLINYEISSENFQNILKENSSILEDLRISLNCEEKLTAVPMITDEIIIDLIKMYRLGIYTKRSAKCINYIRTAAQEERELDKVLLVVESKLCYFDLTFNDRIIRLYRSGETPEFDKIINRMINNKNFIFEPKLINIIYDFYKRNNDVNSLRILVDKLLEDRINPKDTCISIEDILKLINVYKGLEDLQELIKVLSFFEYYKDYKEIQESIIEIIKKIVISTNNKVEKLLTIKDYIQEYREVDPEIKAAYILLVAHQGIKDKEQLDEMVEALRELVWQENFVKKTAISIIKAIIIYFCSRDDYDNIVKYVDFYVYQLALVDNYGVLTELIKTQKTKYIGEAILLSINKIEVRTLNVIIDEACDRVIVTKNYKVIINALKHLPEKKIPGAGYVLALKYLSICDDIVEEEYEILAETLRLLPRDKQMSLYEEMAKRKDFPIEIRLEFFSLCKINESLQILYGAFIRKEIYSRELKDDIAKQYFDDNQQFLKIVSIDSCSLEVLELVNRKVRETLPFDLDYVRELLSAVKNKDSILMDYKNIIDKFINRNSEEISIIGKYEKLVESRNTVCEVGELINILEQNVKYRYIAFNREDVQAFKIKNLLANYMNKNAFEYIADISDNIIAFKEVHYKRQYIIYKINIVLDNLLKLIRFQLILVKHGFTIDEFTLDQLMYSKEIIIPRHFSYLQDGKYGSINEEFNVKAIINYINTMVKAKLEEKITKEETIIIEKLQNLLTSAQGINTYEALILKLSAFIEPLQLNPQRLSFKAQLENFNNLPTVLAKEAVIERIISSKITLVEAKRIIIGWKGKIKNKEAFVDYLLICFNIARTGLKEEELLCLYNKVIGLLRSNPTLINKDKKLMFSINAKLILNLSKERLEQDLYDKKLLTV